MRLLLSTTLEPGARAAAEDLDAFAQANGLPGVELTAPPHGVVGEEWATSGCAWALRRGLYSRRQRQQLLQRLRKGRAFPEWEIREEGDLVVCLHRNFAWRASVLGTTTGAST